MAHRGEIRPLSVAPMMQRTDRHFRVMMRQITAHTLLYTEMVTTGALLHGDPKQILGFSRIERPLALQLGGDDPTALATCAQMGQALGYDEINLNVGCPSPRVGRGGFGACLMLDPPQVARCISAMRSAVDIPVTVKHRIGVDAVDRYEDMLRFVDTVAEAGVDRFTVHARKAWLSGLSPKQNRNVPPLRHAEVWRLKRERPHLMIETNGGIRDLNTAAEHLRHVDAVMIGRGAVDDPMLFAEADTRFFGAPTTPCTPESVVRAMIDQAERWCAHPGHRLASIARHLLPLFNGRRGARRWRQALSAGISDPSARPDVLRQALHEMMTTPHRAPKCPPR